MLARERAKEHRRGSHDASESDRVAEIGPGAGPESAPTAPKPVHACGEGRAAVLLPWSTPSCSSRRNVSGGCQGRVIISRWRPHVPRGGWARAVRRDRLQRTPADWVTTTNQIPPKKMRGRESMAFTGCFNTPEVAATIAENSRRCQDFRSIEEIGSGGVRSFTRRCSGPTTQAETIAALASKGPLAWFAGLVAALPRFSVRVCPVGGSTMLMGTTFSRRRGGCKQLSRPRARHALAGGRMRPPPYCLISR